MQITVNIVDGLTPDLQRRIAAAVTCMQDYYRGLPSNARGFPSRGFWKKQGADRTQVSAFDDRSATVVVDSVEMGHRFFGGTVSAKAGRALSIPISPEAYRAGSASLWTGNPLTLVCRPGKPPLLVETGTMGKTRSWKIHYVLLRSVTHAPDARAFPGEEIVAPAVLQTIRTKLDVILSVSR